MGSVQKTFVRRLSTLQETGMKFETRKKEHLARDGEIAKTKATITKYRDIVNNVNTKDVEK